MALAIHLSTWISGGYTNPIYWRLYETGTGAFVDEHFENGPHGQVYNFSFVNNIRDIVYTVKLYDVPGGIGVGNLIKSHDMTVTTSTLVFDADIETIVDGGEPEDPISYTSTSPAIAALVGKSFYVVQRSIGQRRVERIPEIQINGDGSYTLLSDSETFNPEDTWIIKIRPEFVINPAGSVTGSNFKDVVLITADTTLTSADFGKMFIVDGVLPVVTIQLPELSTIVEKISMAIQSVGTSHINVVVKAAVSETINGTGMIANTFILSRATKAELVKLDGTLYAFTDDNDIKRRGQLNWGYSVGINRLEAYGDEYLVADYPGLKQSMDLMKTGTVVTYAQRAFSQMINNVEVFPYRSYFALSDDGLNFKVPDLKNLMVRGLNGSDSDSERITQGPGGYQNAALEDHSHTSGHEGTFARGASHTITKAAGAGAGNINTAGISATGGVITQAADSDYGISVSETRPENIGLIPLIII